MSGTAIFVITFSLAVIAAIIALSIRRDTRSDPQGEALAEQANAQGDTDQKAAGVVSLISGGGSHCGSSGDCG